MGPFGIDWRKSNAHLLFLSRFRHPSSQAEQGDYWQSALGESPARAIKRFQDEGMLVQAGTARKIDCAFRINDLRPMLQSRGLPASGRKENMIQRLIEADPKGMDEIAAKLPPTLVWSPRGKEIAEEYLANEKAEHNRVEQETMEYLRLGKLKEACRSVANYEAKQPFPRGIGVDWKHYDPTGDVAALEAIYCGKPKILGKLDEGQLLPLRLAAGMAQLWGTNQFEEWLPPGFTTGLKMGNDAAARMLLFSGIHRTTLEGYRRSRVVKKVEVVVARDERLCAACESLADRQFSLDSAPELPYEHCTSEMGCRCCFAPLIRD